MNVKELIKALDIYPDDEPVYIRDLEHPDSALLNAYRINTIGAVILSNDGSKVYTVNDLRGFAEFLHKDARVFVETEHGIFPAKQVQPYDAEEERNEHWALAVECDSLDYEED